MSRDDVPIGHAMILPRWCWARVNQFGGGSLLPQKMGAQRESGFLVTGRPLDSTREPYYCPIACTPYSRCPRPILGRRGVQVAPAPDW